MFNLVTSVMDSSTVAAVSSTVFYALLEVLYAGLGFCLGY